MTNPNNSEPCFDLLVCLGALAGLSYSIPQGDVDGQELWSTRGSVICAQMVLDVAAMTTTTNVPTFAVLGRALELQGRMLDLRPSADVASALGTIIDLLGAAGAVTPLPVETIVSWSCALHALGEARRLALEWESDSTEVADEALSSLSAWCAAVAGDASNLGALVTPLALHPGVDLVRGRRAVAGVGAEPHLRWILWWIADRGELEIFTNALAAARRRMGAPRLAS